MMQALRKVQLEFNLSQLMLPSPIEGKSFVGKVLSVDSKGRIKAEIDPIFKGISESDLPFISMSSNVNTLVSPNVDDFVMIQFMGSVYEGFYNATFITSDLISSLEISDLGTGFEINLDKIKIFGKKDGTEFTIKTPTFEIVVDALSGTSTIQGSGILKAVSDFMILNSGASPILNALTPCQFTGAPHVPTVLTAVVG